MSLAILWRECLKGKEGKFPSNRNAGLSTTFWKIDCATFQHAIDLFQSEQQSLQGSKTISPCLTKFLPSPTAAASWQVGPKNEVSPHSVSDSPPRAIPPAINDNNNREKLTAFFPRGDGSPQTQRLLLKTPRLLGSSTKYRS